MCEVANNNEFSQGLGCNISMNVSDDYGRHSSPKRSGFLGGLIRKNSPKTEQRKPKESSWSPKNVFAKKSGSKKAQEDDRTSELLSQLQLDGRSDAEIAMHLSYINDVPAIAAPPMMHIPIPKKQRTGFFGFFQMIKDEFSLTEEGYMIDEHVLHSMTVSISAAPFFGAPPPDMDMTYEELAALEPVYVGSKCANNLPVCKHDGTPLPGNQTNCPVCLCEFTKGEKLKSLPCVHFYHKECIDRWLLVGHSCPICKALVE